MGARIALTAIALAATLPLSACGNPSVVPNTSDVEASARGKAATLRRGCGACHVIPGIWPQGATGPSLNGFAVRGTIAGRYPNRPDTLAAFLLDPSGTAMPRQPMTPVEAADIAAFLHAPD